MSSCWEGVHDLIARARAGDGQAWGALHEMVTPFLLVHAQRLLGPAWPRESVSDLTQETWQRIVIGIADFAGGDGDDQTAPMFRAWLRRILKNVHANRRRAEQALKRKSPPDQVLLGGAGSLDGGDGRAQGEPPSPDHTASSIIGREERDRLIRRTIARLEDPLDRDLLHQVFFEGNSLRSVAASRGVSPDTLRYHFDGLLRKLKVDLDPLR